MISYSADGNLARLNLLCVDRRTARTVNKCQLDGKIACRASNTDFVV